MGNNDLVPFSQPPLSPRRKFHWKVVIPSAVFIALISAGPKYYEAYEKAHTPHEKRFSALPRSEGPTSHPAEIATASAGSSATNNVPAGRSAQVVTGGQGGAGNAEGQGSQVFSGGTQVTGTTVNGAQYVINVASGARPTFNISGLKAITIIPLPGKKPSTISSVPKKKAIRAYNAGTKALKRNQPEVAEMNFFIALDADPKLAEAHNNLAIALFALGKYAEAEKEWRTALVLDPQNIAYADNLAMGETRSGFGVQPGDRVVSKPGMEGVFGVVNYGPTPRYVYWIRDYEPGASKALPVALPYDPTHPTEPIFMFGRELYAYLCPYGMNQAIDPKIMPELDIEITYSDKPGGTLLKSVFRFVPNLAPSGRWRWYPKV